MTTNDEIQNVRWRKVKQMTKSKIRLDELQFENIKKRRRTRQLSTYDVAMAIHPCLIKRPSIILPEDMKDVRKKIKHTSPILEDLNLSDSEDEDVTNECNKSETVSISQDQYLKSCEKYNVIPISTFYKQLQEKSVVLKNHRFMGKEFKTCVIALFCNETVIHLDIEGNHVGPRGMGYLSDLIYHTDVLVQLNLTKNNIGTEGLMLLEEAMDKNYSLLSLDLSDNNIDDSDCEIIKKIMQGTNLLQFLSLSNNGIGCSGGQQIAKGLAKNEELTSLNLSWNRIRGIGAAAIGYALTENTALEILDISWNGLETGGAHGIAHGLEGNSTLKELNISSNRINKTGLAKLLQGLMRNTSLEALKISDNPMSIHGAFMVLQVSEQHQKLSYLDFGKQPVTFEFEQKISEIRKNRNMVVNFGKVLAHDKKDEGDHTMYINGDPCLILFEFARVQHIHILDMFKTFDADGNHAITWEEFRQGIKQNNIPVRPKDIEKIIQTIDINMDGEVDFSELAISQRAHSAKVENLKVKGEEAFNSSTIGSVNKQLIKWLGDNRLKLNHHDTVKPV